MADFHRLVAPTYNGGLPATHDYINDPVTNGDPGLPAPVDGKKGSGPNEGTYLLAFGEDAISAAFNRAAQALAENTDVLDDIVHADLAMPTLSGALVGANTSEITLTGEEVFVGIFGEVADIRTKNGLVGIIDSNGNPLFIETSVGSGIYAPVLVTGILDASAGSNVIGQEISGFRTSPVIAVNPAIPVATSYRVIYYTRNNVADQDIGMLTRLNSGLIGSNYYNAELYNRTSFAPSDGDTYDWYNGDPNPVATLKEQVAKIITDLAADAGSDRIGSNNIAGSNLSVDDKSIYDQLGDIVSFINDMLDTTENTWGGIQNVRNSIDELGADLLSSFADANKPRVKVTASNVCTHTLLGEFTLRYFKARLYLTYNNGLDISINAAIQSDESWHSDNVSYRAALISIAEDNIVWAIANPSASDLDFDTYKTELYLTPSTFFKSIYNGRLSFCGEEANVNPLYNADIASNALYGKNIAKVWGSIGKKAGPAPEVYEGFNIDKIEFFNIGGLAGGGLKVTFKHAFASTNYSISANFVIDTGLGTPYIGFICPHTKAVGYCILIAMCSLDYTAFTPHDWSAVATVPERIDFSIFGEQAAT